MNNFVLECELSLLLNRKPSVKDEENGDLLSVFYEGNYETCLKNKKCQDIWRADVTEQCETLDSILRSCVRSYVKSEDNPELRQITVLICGVVSLQLFVQNNWTGPRTTTPAANILQHLLEDVIKSNPTLISNDNFTEEIKEHATKALNLDGNLYSKIVYPEYLWIARILLSTCLDSMNYTQTYSWWSLRCVFIHQQMLLEKSPSLCTEANKCIDKMTTTEPFMTGDDFRMLQLEFHLETAQIFVFYYEMSKTKQQLTTATKLSRLNISITGALGKRTYFQVENKAQLKLNVERSCSETIPSNYSSTETPTDVKLNDSVRRETISFVNEVDNAIPDILPEEQSLLLHLYLQKQNASAVHKLVEEELLAYLVTIISQPKVWSVQMKALILRAQLESKEHRSVERSMLQLQELVNDFYKLQPNVSRRLILFYSSFLPPFWKLEVKLADLLLSLGVTNSALEIYLKLEIWDKVILCYQLLKRKSQAEEIVRQELNVKETPNLWCTLGDITDEVFYYEKAWELSNHRSARAQKCLGEYYFLKKEYLKSIPYFQKSLELNHLQLSVTSSLAYAAMQSEQWEIAASTYRHCVNLEPDNYQAWNNLANAYLKLKQKPRAWKTLQEALRCDFDNWRIWENYLVVSTDCAAFEEAINAYHRVLDLKEKHVDVEILTLLVKAVTEDLSDNGGNGCFRLKSKLSQLFGRLTSQVTSNCDLWNLYANLTEAKSDNDALVMEKVLQFRQKAQRSLFTQVGWEKNTDDSKKLVELSLVLADAYLQQTTNTSDGETQRVLSSAKLMLKGVLNKLHNYKQSLLNAENTNVLDELLVQLNSKLKRCY